MIMIIFKVTLLATTIMLPAYLMKYQAHWVVWVWYGILFLNTVTQLSGIGRKDLDDDSKT